MLAKCQVCGKPVDHEPVSDSNREALCVLHASDLAQAELERAQRGEDPSPSAYREIVCEPNWGEV